jgi:RNAse (barnase) inhibitor barstar
MKSARLDETHDSLAKVYAKLAADLSFPAHFAGNLDALWDVLLRDVSGPFEIVWPGAAKAGARIGPKYKALVLLLDELEEARGDFKFRRR